MLGGEIGPSPVFVNGFVYAANDACGLSVVRADGTGDVTETHVVWHTEIDAPDIVSPLVTDKCVLLLTHGLLAGFDAQLPAEGTGGGEVEEREPLWEEELQEEVSASPGLVGNLVYLFSETGQSLDCRAAGRRLQTRRGVRNGGAGAVEPGVPARQDLHSRRGTPHLYRYEVNEEPQSMYNHCDDTHDSI